MIAAYQGVSWRSRICRFLTWSKYSHVSWVDPEGWEIEAWSSGVRCLQHAHSDHTPGTLVDLFSIDLEQDELNQLRDFLRAQVGKKYDFIGNLHFITRHHEYSRDRDRWFCSELIAEAFRSIRHPLLERIESFKVYPAMITYSPLLRHVHTHVVSADGTTGSDNPAGPRVGFSRSAAPQLGHTMEVPA